MLVRRRAACQPVQLRGDAEVQLGRGMPHGGAKIERDCVCIIGRLPVPVAFCVYERRIERERESADRHRSRDSGFVSGWWFNNQNASWQPVNQGSGEKVTPVGVLVSWCPGHLSAQRCPRGIFHKKRCPPAVEYYQRALFTCSFLIRS